jgi:hypothetical protein
MYAYVLEYCVRIIAIYLILSFPHYFQQNMIIIYIALSYGKRKQQQRVKSESLSMNIYLQDFYAFLSW